MQVQDTYRRSRVLRLIAAGIMVLTGLTAVACKSGNGVEIIPPVMRDFTATLTDFGPHEGQLVEARILDDNNRLQGYAIINPLESGNYSFRMAGLLGEGSYGLDMFADFNGDSGYDAPPVDHAWRYAVPPTGVLSIMHNTDFTDIASPAFVALGGGFVMQFVDYQPHAGQLLELKVVNEDGRVVGYYRLGEVPDTGQFSINIPGIIVSGEDYTVDYYADYNNDGNYDAPPVDHAWRSTAVGTPSGMSIAVIHNTNFTDVQF
jgi:hypothetical protein